MKWHETFEIAEYYGFSEKKLDDLLNKINDKFSVTGHDVRPKIKTVKWANNVNYKFFEFIFGNVEGGAVFLGTITLAKQKTSVGDSFDAVTGLYKLNFQPGRIRNEVRRHKRFLGIVTDSWTDTWYDPVNIGYLTQETVKNLCRAKAMDIFQEEGLVIPTKVEL